MFKLSDLLRSKNTSATASVKNFAEKTPFKPSFFNGQVLPFFEVGNTF